MTSSNSTQVFKYSMQTRNISVWRFWDVPCLTCLRIAFFCKVVVWLPFISSGEDRWWGELILTLSYPVRLFHSSLYRMSGTLQPPLLSFSSYVLRRRMDLFSWQFTQARHAQRIPGGTDSFSCTETSKL